MKHIHQTYTIKASAAAVWRALTNPAVIDQWGGGPAKMDAKEGAEFSLWGGDIHGRNTKVILNELLAQDWYSGDWSTPSKLEFRLSEHDGVTTVELNQADLPDDEAADIAQGWEDYYLGPIKRLLES